ncbi:MAG: SpoIIE family protein phosphatase, partial [Phycisphaerales bacterium]|nr:SpoIIE family protein phosphatase [Phycisphaerales bacterium]
MTDGQVTSAAGTESSPATHNGTTTSSYRGHPHPLLRGMHCVDTSRNPKIPLLMELVADLSRATEPREVLRTFSRGIRKITGPVGYISLSTRDLPAGHYRITRQLLDPRTEHIDIADTWSTMHEITLHSGGFLGALIQSAYPELIHDLDVRDDPVLGDALAPFRSLLAIPLFDGGEPLNWAIMLKEEPDGFSIDDLEETILRSNLIGGRVKGTVVAQELQKANETIRREVERIAAIQRALLPQSMPDIPGVRLAAEYNTYDQAGGDYYDIQPLKRTDDGAAHDPNGPWVLIIADAAGHGPAAAVLMAMLHAILHAYPHMPGGPGEVLTHVNTHLARKQLESSFVTAFLAIYDPPTRTLTYARAGHPPPMLKDPGPGGTVRRLDAVGGVPLGILNDARFEDASVTLEPGQAVVMYTDGITEGMNHDHRMFGVAGVERALTNCSGEPDCS